MSVSLATNAKSSASLIFTRSLFLWSLCLVTGFGFAAEQNPEKWLSRMAQSLKNSSYEGVFVYLNGIQLESMRVVRAVDEEGEWERLISLNGKKREIVRNGRAVTSILPHARSVVSRDSTQESSFPVVLGESFETLQANYQFRAGAFDRIAERKALQVIVKPRDEYRYGYKLWLDAVTAIPLKVALVNERGFPLEQVMYTQFRILDAGSIPSIPELAPSPEGIALEHVESSPSSRMQWVSGELPDGFSLNSHSEERMPGSRQKVHHLVFSDGLVKVSAYVEQMGERRGLKGSSRRGSISAFGLRQEGFQITVVGEVPLRTVERIANSIQAPLQ